VISLPSLLNSSIKSSLKGWFFLSEADPLLAENISLASLVLIFLPEKRRFC